MKVTKAAISIFCSKEKPAYSKPPLRPKRRSSPLCAPSLIAEVATLTQVPFPASAEAIGTATVLKIERERFLSLLREDPSLSITMIASLTQKIGALEASLQRHSAPNASAKVARLLLEDSDAFRRLKGIERRSALAITPKRFPYP